MRLLALVALFVAALLLAGCFEGPKGDPGLPVRRVLKAKRGKKGDKGDKGDPGRDAVATPATKKK